MWKMHSSRILKIGYLRGKTERYEWNMDANREIRLPCFKHERLNVWTKFVHVQYGGGH